jgi:N-acetyl-anhydromuramyl-L-alanine amidase AmpD
MTQSYPSLQSRVVHLDNALYHGPVRPKSAIDIIGWHSTRGHGASEAMQWDNRAHSDNPACYNYVVDRDDKGTIYRTLADNLVPYSNGDANWPDPLMYPPGNHHSINRRILAIALAGDLDDAPGKYKHVTPAQLESAWWLGKTVSEQFPYADHVGHLETSPGRKDDPRPAFLHMSWWRAVLTESQCPTYDEYLDVHPLAAAHR